MNRRTFLRATGVASGALLLENGTAGAVVNPSDAARGGGYDYIIVGAGTAGCVLANRLTEGGASVVLIEAGGPDNSEAISTPARLFELWGSQYDWAYSTDPQVNAGDRQIYWPRSKVLGGSSSLNGMVHIRGNPDNYDAWARLGNAGWDYKSLLPYFIRSEDFDRGASRLRGAGGPLRVTSQYEPHPVTKIMAQAAEQAGYRFNADNDAEANEGVSFAHLNTKDGLRHSAAVAYLRPAIERTNLTLITSARVDSVAIDGRGRARGVTYTQDGRTKKLRARNEVLLAGGTIASPQLLMLSGIGDRKQLREHGIRLRRHLPGVGQNLHDHTAVPVIFEASQPLPPPSDPSLQTFHGQVYLKSEPHRPAPDTQLLFIHVPGYSPGQESLTDNGYTLTVAGYAPTSRGQLRLTGANITDPLSLDPNVFDTDYDIGVIINGIRLSRKIAEQPALAGITAREIYPGPDVQSDDDLAAYARATTVSYHHQVGTCKMGRDRMAVVDSELRVHGVQGLRVIDASIMPNVTTANTNATVVMIAEKASDLIRGGY